MVRTVELSKECLYRNKSDYSGKFYKDRENMNYNDYKINECLRFKLERVD